MKNIYCIVGPSGCGKTTLVNALQDKYRYKAIESYTTRPPRSDGEKGHIFVSPNEFKLLGEIYAYNQYDGYEYGITADLIAKNELYVVEPSGVEDLFARYKGEKGIKVIGINAAPDVLVERMRQRGDSDSKIIKRLAADAETFKHLSSITDITLRSDWCSVEELCEAVNYHIENFEAKHKHEFSLLNEKGEVITDGCRFFSYDDAFASLQNSETYANGLPSGWTLRDDTELEREKYVKAIKKLKPNFKISMIKVNMESSFTGSDGYTLVSFSYKDKNYVYRDFNGDSWITKDIRTYPEWSAEDSLTSEINLLNKQMAKFQNDPLKECIDTENERKTSRKASYTRLEETVDFLKCALKIVQQKEKEVSESPLLDEMLNKATLASKHQNIESIVDKYDSCMEI